MWKSSSVRHRCIHHFVHWSSTDFPRDPHLSIRVRIVEYIKHDFFFVLSIVIIILLLIILVCYVYNAEFDGYSIKIGRRKTHFAVVLLRPPGGRTNCICHGNEFGAAEEIRNFWCRPTFSFPFHHSPTLGSVKCNREYNLVTQQRNEEGVGRRTTSIQLNT